jgi:hypothetical protein
MQVQLLLVSMFANTHACLLPRMPRIQMQQSRHIKSSDIFSPRTESLPAIFPEGSFMGCDLEGVVFDKRLVLSSCNFSGEMRRCCRRCLCSAAAAAAYVPLLPLLLQTHQPVCHQDAKCPTATSRPLHAARSTSAAVRLGCGTMLGKVQGKEEEEEEKEEEEEEEGLKEF